MAQATNRIEPAYYNAFIQQIELQALWLVESRIVNHYGPASPKHAELSIGVRARWEPSADGFQAFQGYIVQVHQPETPDPRLVAKLEIEFGVAYRSKQKMTGEIFDVFQNVNLPLNTWPYLRSLVAETFGRMNWLPFALPAVKFATEPTPSVPDRLTKASRSTSKHASKSQT